MKIVHEIGQLAYGGVERIVHDLIKFDDKNDHSIITYKEGPFRKEFEKLGVKIHLLNEETTEEMPLDLLHIHTGGGDSIAAEQLKGEIPIVETIHSPVRSRVRDNIITQRIGVSDGVTSLNKDCKTILNGIDFTRFNTENNCYALREKYGIQPNQIVIGRCGRVARDKNLEDWLLTCYYLQAKGFDIVPFIIGGESVDSPGHVGKMKLIAESLPVRNVIWAGHQDNPSDLMDIMDIFLYPSPTEGFGLVFIEAMFRGIPVVTYKTDVTMSLFGGYSFLSQPEKGIFGLCDQVFLAMKKEITNEMVPLAYDYVQSEFQADRMANDYQKLYESLV